MITPVRRGGFARVALRTGALAGAAVLLAGCGSVGPRAATSARPRAAGSSSPSSSASAGPTPATTSPGTAIPPSAAAVDPQTAARTAARPASSTPVVARGNGQLVVVDPGHSPTITSTDPATGLDDSTYENEPEMRDVWAVSLLVRDRLVADGYRVILTKDAVDDRVSLGQRAAVANDNHAALAISVHDQAGANGGIPFATGNNIVYYQSVGGYRETPDGTHVTFTDAAVADTSRRYGAIFQQQRAAAEGHPVTLMGDTGYDQGTRGHAPGDMWMVQLLSTVPWIYHEAGGNSAGTVGLTPADEQRYADGLVAGVEACLTS